MEPVLSYDFNEIEYTVRQGRFTAPPRDSTRRWTTCAHR